VRGIPQAGWLVLAPSVVWGALVACYGPTEASARPTSAYAAAAWPGSGAIAQQRERGARERSNAAEGVLEGHANEKVRGRALAAHGEGGVAGLEGGRGVAAIESRDAEPSCSTEMVLVEGSCVDRYEAHLLDTTESGALVIHPPHERPGPRPFRAASAPGVKPQAYISQVEAAEACEQAGKRLCTLSEWYRACTGPSRATYPYGSGYQAGRCNVAKPHLMTMVHGANPKGWSYANFNDPALNQRQGFLALTGEYAECASAEGIHDMVGNVHEWVADRVDRSLSSKVPNPAIAEGRIGRRAGNGIFMGGFFSTLNEHGAGCTFTTAAHEPRYHDYSTGFRCCRDAGAANQP